MREYKPLAEICENLDKRRKPISKKDRVSGDIPYYGASGIVDYVEDYIFDEELLLVSEDGANLLARSTPIAFSIDGKTWVNNHAHVLKFDDFYLQKYVEFYLNSISLESYITGSAQPKLNQAKLQDIMIPIVGTEETKVRAEALMNIKKIIEYKKQTLDYYDTLIKSRFVEMFGDPIINDKGWPHIILGDLCDIGSSKRIFEKEYVSVGIPFYRTREIVELSKGNKVSSELFISHERFNEIRDKYGVPQCNDLLISAVGTIGTIWIVDGKNDFYFKDGNLLRISASTTFNSIYMKFLLEALIDNYKHSMSSGTAYAALTISGLKNMNVSDVPIVEQKKFADFVKQVDKLKLEVQKSLEETQLMFDSLMQKYFD